MTWKKPGRRRRSRFLERCNNRLAADVGALAAERDAVILAHPVPEILDVTHHIGDSMSLPRIRGGATQQEIVFRGVNFMAETAKLLSPDRRMLLPTARPAAFWPTASPPSNCGTGGRALPRGWADHALIHANFPRLPNVGYVVAEQLFHP